MDIVQIISPFISLMTMTKGFFWLRSTFLLIILSFFLKREILDISHQECEITPFTSLEKLWIIQLGKWFKEQGELSVLIFFIEKGRSVNMYLHFIYFSFTFLLVLILLVYVLVFCRKMNCYILSLWC